MLSGSSESQNRAAAGQLGVMGRQIEEVAARVTIFRNYGDIENTLTVPSGTIFDPSGEVTAITTRNIPIPPPPDGGRRRPIIFLSGESIADNFGTISGRVIVGAFGYAQQMFAPIQASAPIGFNEAFNWSVIGDIGDTSFSMSVRSIASYNTGPARTVLSGVRNVRLVVTYGAVE